MLFKQAAGTGWDCPRAHILVMFREIQSPTFYVQTVGRILRNADPYNKKDYNESIILRCGYLYTNYKRNEIAIPDQSSKNKPFVYTSQRKADISNIDSMTSDYISRTDYGDLGNAFQFQLSFINSFNSFFSITENDFLDSTREKIKSKGIELQPHLSNKLIVDAEFSDYDKLNFDFNKLGHEYEYKMSRNDVERLFNFWCYRLLSEQTEDEAKIANISRSWSPFKSALRVWFKKNLDMDSDYYYRVFIYDINRNQSSVFRQAITRALKDYAPKRFAFIESKKKMNEEQYSTPFYIKEEYSFTEDFETIKSENGSTELSIIQPFYIRKEYNGKKNELLFVNYLESKKNIIEWWFKNGDGGKDYFGLRYLNTTTCKESLFYPDWIVKFKNGKIGIFDTKSGNTAVNPEGRAEGLYNKLCEMNKVDNIYYGGLVILENNQWYCSVSLPYNYQKGHLSNNWVLLEDLLI